MKYVLVIGDGIADEPTPLLGGKTPLETTATPNADQLAGAMLGTAQTVPEGVVPGSDTAILSIFGYDPRTCFTGRSALEAAGSGVSLAPGETSLRVNLCALDGDCFENTRILSHNGGGIEGDEAQTLMEALVCDPFFSKAANTVGLRIAITRTFRHIGVLDAAHQPPRDQPMRFTEPHNVLGEAIAPHLPQGFAATEMIALMRASYQVLCTHPINRARVARGLLPANCIWPWGPGSAMHLENFPEKFRLTGAVVSAVPLVWGIAALCGLDAPRVPGATGELETNYAGKVDAALAALEAGADFAAIHVEAPDECAHGGDAQGKCEAIGRIDARVLGPLLERLPLIDTHFRLLYMSDHPTLLTTRGHDASPVPFALYDSRTATGASVPFDEVHARATGLHLSCASRELLPLLFETGKAGRI